MNIPEGYTDAFGIVYSGGIVIPTDINVSCQSNKFFQYADGSYNQSNSNESASISFRAVAFVNQAALDDGKRPLNFVPNTGGEYFSFQISMMDLPQTDAEAVALCENYLQQKVFSVA